MALSQLTRLRTLVNSHRDSVASAFPPYGGFDARRGSGSVIHPLGPARSVTRTLPSSIRALNVPFRGHGLTQRGPNSSPAATTSRKRRADSRPFSVPGSHRVASSESSTQTRVDPSTYNGFRPTFVTNYLPFLLLYHPDPDLLRWPLHVHLLSPRSLDCIAASMACNSNLC